MNHWQSQVTRSVGRLRGYSVCQRDRTLTGSGRGRLASIQVDQNNDTENTHSQGHFGVVKLKLPEYSPPPHHRRTLRKRFLLLTVGKSSSDTTSRTAVNPSFGHGTQFVSADFEGDR